MSVIPLHVGLWQQDGQEVQVVELEELVAILFDMEASQDEGIQE